MLVWRANQMLGTGMNDSKLSRRNFMQSGVALAGGSWLRFSIPGLAAMSQAACGARDETRQFTTLSSAEATEFEAIAARILPTTDTPGAREAGVIWFFDQTFGTFHAKNLDYARNGLAEFQQALEGDLLFSELEESAQDEYLTTRDQSSFFNLVRFMTVCGFFGMSKYGGNKDDLGWKLIEVDPHQHAFQPPFGYYDAEYARENGDA